MENRFQVNRVNSSWRSQETVLCFVKVREGAAFCGRGEKRECWSIHLDDLRPNTAVSSTTFTMKSLDRLHETGLPGWARYSGLGGYLRPRGCCVVNRVSAYHAVQRLGHCGTLEHPLGNFLHHLESLEKMLKNLGRFEPLDLFSDSPSSLQSFDRPLPKSSGSPIFLANLSLHTSLPRTR